MKQHLNHIILQDTDLDPGYSLILQPKQTAEMALNTIIGCYVSIIVVCRL